MRIASLRPSWCLPSAAQANELDHDQERRKNDLWGWIHEDAAADAFLRSVDPNNKKWSGHETFFIVAPDTTQGTPQELYEKYWKHVPIKEGKNLDGGFFDCSKAERLLGWVHPPPVGSH